MSPRRPVQRDDDRAVIGGRAATWVPVRVVEDDLLERGLVDELPGAVVGHDEVDGLCEAGVAFAVAVEGQPPQIQARGLSVVDLTPDDAQQPQQLTVLLDQDLGPPAGRPLVLMQHADGLDVAFGHGIEHPAPDGEPGVDPVRALLGTSA
jgi:hypothetical protein